MVEVWQPNNNINFRSLGTGSSLVVVSFLRKNIYFESTRVATKTSSYRVNITSRQGIKQLGISFGSTFLLLSYESSCRGPHSKQLGKSPAPGS